ncbi:MAG TPA: hypothetical protein VHG29_03650 [Novosphingobium sp.]|nr:hypothetical protein [Novosphingobium sp.]
MARIRSPRYPFHNLDETIELVAKIHAEDRQHPVGRDVAARHMGFSGISGTSDRALASLMHYGLAEKAVKGEIRVSSLALEILHPSHDGERTKALNTAGFNPELFQELRQRYPEAPPSAASLESFLTRSGFAPVAIRPASKAYLETCQFLQRNGAYESDGETNPLAAESADQIDPKEPYAVSAQSTTINPATFAASVSAIRGDVFTLQGGGEVIANLPDSMTQRDYDDLKDWLELMIRKAGRKVVVQTSIAAPVDEDEDGDED